MYKAAIIGCGNIAGGYGGGAPDLRSLTHAGAYYLCPDTELIAAADVSAQVLNEFGNKWKIDNLYVDYKHMIKHEEIDILSICSPTETHYEAFQHACQENIPAIFCEKPLSYDISEAKKMAMLSQGKVIAVNYFRRWNPTILKIRNELINGIYGKIAHVTVQYTKGIFVNGSHLVDLMRWVFGEPNEIYLVKNHNPDAQDPGVDFVLSFEDAITAYFLHVPNIEYVFINIDILTEKGRIILAQRGQRAERYDIVLEPYYQRFDILQRVEDMETGWRECMTAAVQEIADCLKGSKDHVSCSISDGLKSMEICQKVVSRTGEK